MTPEQALDNLDKAASQLQASRDTHALLQVAVSILKEAIKGK